MDAKYNYKQVADYFIAFSNETQSLITNLKLQKLVYYAQAWHLAIHKNPLFDSEFEAWIHGPVIPALYADYKQFSWKPIIREDLTEEAYKSILSQFDDSAKELLSDVITEYFTMDAYALEKSTHLEDPWIIARKGYASDDPCTEIISKESMLEFYTPYINNG